MAQRKPYNPNTAYGRRKLREEAERNYQNDTPQGKQDRDNMGFIVIIIIVVIIFLIFAATGNLKGFFKWMSH
ncbi:MAG: hypothetical protein JNK27_09910 [Chitinophagaceae bacterium]|nr:hypothetical protein [Chitinophagaceae bacterium]